MKNITIQMEALGCPSCMVKIENAVRSLKGVDESSLKVLFNASKVKLNYDETELSENEIEDAINKFGYRILSTKIKDL
jgi:copper chaperone CopZ